MDNREWKQKFIILTVISVRFFSNSASSDRVSVNLFDAAIFFLGLFNTPDDVNYSVQGIMGFDVKILKLLAFWLRMHQNPFSKI